MGQRITELRRAAGLSKNRLSKMVGVSEGSVRYWERHGIRTAQYALMARAARALGVAMEDLDDGGAMDDPEDGK